MYRFLQTGHPVPDGVSRPADSGGLASLRVVLCEDDRSERRWILATLASDGWDVVGVADTGAGALELARGARPDLVVVDVALLGTAGFHYADRLRALTPGTSLILVSPLGELQIGPGTRGIDGVVGAHDVAAFRRALAGVRLARARRVH